MLTTGLPGTRCFGGNNINNYSTDAAAQFSGQLVDDTFCMTPPAASFCNNNTLQFCGGDRYQGKSSLLLHAGIRKTLTIS